MTYRISSSHNPLEGGKGNEGIGVRSEESNLSLRAWDVTARVVGECWDQVLLSKFRSLFTTFEIEYGIRIPDM